MNKIVDTLIVLLRSAVMKTNEEIDLSDLNWEALYSLAEIHDLAHIVYYELKQRNALDKGEIVRNLENKFKVAIYRHIKREMAIEKVRTILENARIPFILLKGSYIMNLYPESWMRTSSDVDVLVQPADHSKVIEIFKGAGLTIVSKTAHDISFCTQEQYHVELHHSLIEENRLPKTTEILEQVWQYTSSIENRYEKLLNDEMFYFYHLAHMAKHLKNGGCGVRYFIDLWLLNHKKEFDQEKRNRLISQSGLSEFAKQSEELSEKWFSNKQFELPEYEEFIIQGGIYGSLEQGVAIWKKKAKGRFFYYAERFFLPYSKMKHLYPILRKLPVLLPFYWIFRLFSKKKRAINEIKTEISMDNEYADRIAKMIKQLNI